MPSKYLNFDLKIGTRQGREYLVTVSSPSGEANATIIFPYDKLVLENRLLTLQNVLLRSGSDRRVKLTEDELKVREFGKALFNAALVGDVRTHFYESRRMASQQDAGLRIRLRIADPSLAALPWEFLYDTRYGYVCLSANTPLVRYVELPQAPEPLAVTVPLRILGMIASPTDLRKLDLEREQTRLEKAIEPLRAKGLMEVTWLEGQTWQDLQRTIRRGTWHIFHFAGHGAFNANADEGLVMLADDTGHARPLRATELGTLLKDHLAMRLVMLNACEGGRSSERDIFSSTASILVQAGLPAVLAMQYEITDQAAIELTKAFYEALADKLPVDAALAEARKAVSVAVSNSFEWGTPVLYMRAPDGMLFNLVTPVDVVPTPTLPTPVQPTREVQRVRVQLPFPTIAIPKPSQRFLGRVLLPLAVLVIVVGVLVLSARGVGVFPLVLEPETAETEAAQGASAPASGLSGIATVTPTGATPRSQGISSAATAAGTNTAAAARIETVTIAPTDTPTQSPSLPVPSSKIVFSERGVTVTNPVKLELVRVPAGEFMMGSDPDKDTAANDNEMPQHQVTLAEFFIGKYEVTNAQYAVFIDATGYSAPKDWENRSVPHGKMDHPVVYVSRYDALEFAKWLSEETGESFRLPTEAEWEKACRGIGGFIYPWGDEFDANNANTNESGIGTTAPVGTYSPGGNSPSDAADMAGNVNEWTGSLLMDYPYDSADGREDLSTFTRGWVFRGGSYFNSVQSVRCARRISLNPLNPVNSGPDLGFRVVLAPP